MGYIVEQRSGKYADCISEQTTSLKIMHRLSASSRAHPKSDTLLSLSRSEQHKESCYIRRPASYCAGGQIPNAGASLLS